MSARTPLMLAAALAAASVAAAPAGAIDETKPGLSCYGNWFTDKAGDAKSSGPASAQANGNQDTPNLDLLSAFWKYDADKGDEATTVNIVVKNLNKDIPPGATSIAWMMRYGGSDGTEHWVRAATDFSGVMAYDYGNIAPAGVTSFSVRQGATNGNFFEGENGLVQLVIPTANGDGKPGFTIKGATVYGYEANSPIPQSAPTPVKGGFLYENDSAPGKGGFTVGAACPVAVPEDPAAVIGNPGTVLRPAEQALGLRLTTKRAKAGKKLSLKVRSSEAVTKLAAQVVKGKTVYAKGSMSKLNGSGTLKMKVSRKLKKGSYKVDFAGTDSSGARRFASAKLTVR